MVVVTSRPTGSEDHEIDLNRAGIPHRLAGVPLGTATYLRFNVTFLNGGIVECVGMESK